MKEIIATFIAVAVAVLLGPLAVMLCWNVVIPAVFGLVALTYKQSFCLCLLVWLLFGKSENTKKN